MGPEPTPPAYLVIQEGPQAGKRIELWKDCTSIGRTRDCDIFLEDITVHRKQASILCTEMGYALRDDHGTGDSLINGKPLKGHPQLLHDSDQLLFGHTHVTFFSHEATRQFQLPSSRGRELHIGKNPDPEPITMAKLECLTAQGGVLSFEIQSEMTIGRSRDCSLFLEDLAVSRLHATIRELPNEACELVDNRSATGTFVNGQPITRHQLQEGDEVQIGASRFTFRRSAL